MIAKSHSGDMETLWRGGCFIRSRPCSGFGNYPPPTRFNCLFEQGMWGLEDHIGLPALQPVPCLSGSCLGVEQHGCLVFKYRGLSLYACSVYADSDLRVLEK